MEGTAPIKEQYIDKEHKFRTASHLPAAAVQEIDDVKDHRQVAAQAHEGEKITDKRDNKVDEPPKKKLRGRNKKRPIEKNPQGLDRLCPAAVREEVCPLEEGKCKFSHDVAAFMANKPEDLEGKCPSFSKYGRCKYGVTCRFAKTHTTDDYKNIVNEELHERTKDEKHITNSLDKDIQMQLWKHKYNFSASMKIINSVNKSCSQINKDNNPAANVMGEKIDVISSEVEKTIITESSSTAPPGEKNVSEECTPTEPTKETEGVTELNETKPVVVTPEQTSAETIGADCLLPASARDKRTIDFRDKLYLAPLTTVGNLPFRYVCKNFGVDITCGEMALPLNLVKGQQSEWALLKRHSSEDVFGVQLCSTHADIMTKCAQLVQEHTDVDFIDINCGCPIDMIYQKGDGCGIMSRNNKLERCVRSVSQVLDDIPLTLKLRTGVKSHKPLAHSLIPKIQDWGAQMITLHGRSREQRYTRLADWDYIQQCATLPNVTIPIFGNGDILSYEDYNLHRKDTNVSGIMVARGAIIKPWLFTEIKEQRHWDISSSERMDMLKQFVHTGLEHWGSDQKGVVTTRRFLLEWLSFLHRYIPVGLLERLPQRIHDKPPYYFGRDDLETLMASPNCADWIKITEMLLGPVPDTFTFLPKHKANAYQ